MLRIINTIMKKPNTQLLIDYILNEETRQERRQEEGMSLLPITK
jgi:hypothetical protein